MYMHLDINAYRSYINNCWLWPASLFPYCIQFAASAFSFQLHWMLLYFTESNRHVYLIHHVEKFPSSPFIRIHGPGLSLFSTRVIFPPPKNAIRLINSICGLQQLRFLQASIWSENQFGFYSNLAKWYTGNKIAHTCIPKSNCAYS